jgi:N-acetylmuramoyl-L-alanine amidase CwlA
MGKPTGSVHDSKNSPDTYTCSSCHVTQYPPTHGDPALWLARPSFKNEKANVEEHGTLKTFQPSNRRRSFGLIIIDGPRYHPDWIPTWNRTKKYIGHCEDSKTLSAYVSALVSRQMAPSRPDVTLA